MMTGILSAAALATMSFALIKCAFVFIVWYTRDEDPLFRRKLDTLWDALQERTTFQIIQLSLRQVVESLQVFTTSRKGIIIFTLAFLLTNLIAIAVAAPIWRCSIIKGFSPTDSCYSSIAQWTYDFWGDWRSDLFSTCLASMIGLLLFISLASLLASQRLIGLAASAGHAISLIVLLVSATAVIAIASYASWWVYVALNQYIIWQGEAVPCIGVLSFNLADTVSEKFTLMSERVDRYVQNISNEDNKFGVYWVGVWLGAVSAFPLVITFLASSVLLMVRVMPKVANDFFVKCLYLISTDKAPVLSYVGTIVGVIVAVFYFFLGV
jgi:hypothetical protein